MVKISGGDALEKRLKEIAENANKATSVDIGFLENATYEDGTPVAMIAAIQEFGAPAAGQRTQKGKIRAKGMGAIAKEFNIEAGIGIPPRPFFRSMIMNKSSEWPDAVAGLLKANDYDARKTLEQTGAAIAGQLRQSIIDTNSPPLSPKTIAAKGFAKPLIDTGHMLNSIDHMVKEK